MARDTTTLDLVERAIRNGSLPLIAQASYAHGLDAAAEAVRITAASEAASAPTTAMVLSVLEARLIETVAEIIVKVRRHV